MCREIVLQSGIGRGEQLPAGVPDIRIAIPPVYAATPVIQKLVRK
jgi:hypothetical protein